MGTADGALSGSRLGRGYSNSGCGQSRGTGGGGDRRAGNVCRANLTGAVMPSFAGFGLPMIILPTRTSGRAQRSRHPPSPWIWQLYRFAWLFLTGTGNRTNKTNNLLSCTRQRRPLLIQMAALLTVVCF
eukprot:SAG22_NODE_128_length_18787_cov_19.577108_17_plen_129_part_00